MDFFLKYIIEHYILSKRGKKKINQFSMHELSFSYKVSLLPDFKRELS